MENNGRGRRSVRDSPLQGLRSELATQPSRPEHAATLVDRIEYLVDRVSSIDALKAHRLELAAARVWRSRGQVVPSDLRSHERAAALRGMLANPVLEKARRAYGGSLMLMKGPEVAAHYPVPTDRPFRDLDLLADDAPAAQRALITAGFVQIADSASYAEHQHLCPLLWPGMPLAVEIHHRPNQPAWLEQASAERLFRLGVPSATGVDGILAPDPAVHGVMLVAHAWTHEPLGRIGDLLDIAAVLGCGDRERASALAQEWGWDRMWHTTLAVMDALLSRRAPSVSLSVWARHISGLRERRVLETHIARFAAPACSLPPAEVPGALLHVLRDIVAPGNDEGWRTQARRSGLAIAHAFKKASDHERSLPVRG
jgi:Uncharacterised nucleotidyltransferase